MFKSHENLTAGKYNKIEVRSFLNNSRLSSSIFSKEKKFVLWKEKKREKIDDKEVVENGRFMARERKIIGVRQ